MRRLILVLVMGMLSAWNQQGAAQVVTGESSTAISVQSNQVKKTNAFVLCQAKKRFSWSGLGTRQTAPLEESRRRFLAMAL